MYGLYLAGLYHIVTTYVTLNMQRNQMAWSGQPYECGELNLNPQNDEKEASANPKCFPQFDWKIRVK